MLGKTAETYKDDSLKYLLLGLFDDDDVDASDKSIRVKAVRDYEDKIQYDKKYSVPFEQTYHAVALVFSQSHLINDDVTEKIVESYQTFVKLGYQPIVIVTHLDELNAGVVDDPNMSDPSIDGIMRGIDSKIKVPFNNLKRAVLYHDISEPKFSIDRNTYIVFEQMLKFASDYLNAVTAKKRPSSTIYSKSPVPPSTSPTSPSFTFPALSSALSAPPSPSNPLMQVKIQWDNTTKIVKVAASTKLNELLKRQIATKFCPEGNYIVQDNSV